ncbi:transglycosylase domain-containing protein [Profundibacterium mesophilum]|uniref:peptidoglycan glycosyltransferase n=1 Tax=Profundibacterium mesophilum KAUST100406-0324 TaxID=1037889 RepID=A0A921TCM6_9RHOB|nr:PBP1A family penicillin-binding protein [Profundibacterium mesophilum]KAF0677295.1 Glycosyl transferase family 51 [Profundibacterium mesophilum KAUST100406-0324]
MTGTGRKKPPLVAERRRGTAEKKTAAPRKRRKPAARKARRRGLIGWITGLVRWIVRLGWGLAWRGTAIIALLLALGTYYIYTTLPPVTELLDGRARGSVTMLDRHGEVFAWRGEQFGGQIDARQVSVHLRNAVIATEDRRFYEHFGISPRGVAGAVRINLSEGRGPLSGHGGSTITQQTAKLLCLGEPYDPDTWESERAYEDDCRQGSLWRKLKEAVFALAMEAKYSKDEILTIYLNRAYLGAGTRGFEAAAQRYFGKSANEVQPAEAAMLAGLLVAPTRYAPTSNIERSRDRAATVIRLMEEQDYLTAQQANAALEQPATLSEAAEARAGGYFADWVMETVPDFLAGKTTEDVILSTTFDPEIQRAAEGGLRETFETKVREGSKAQAALVVMSSDGAVRAMVGGRKFKGVAGQFNRAIMAKRQTGSAFKPFVYAAALELGFEPYDLISDDPLTLNIPGSGAWSPNNYDNRFRGDVTLAEALRDSLNIPAVRLSERIGRENVRKVAEDFGIVSDLASGPALALGASESTLLEMTGAYAGILNGGSSVTPYGLSELRLQANSTPLIGQAGGLGERVISQEAARKLVWMMSRVVEEGTGTRARLPDREAAGKTGTTQAARDAWFLGFTADYVAGVWMGYDDNTPLTGVTGGGLPAEIWKEAMLRIEGGQPARPLPMDLPAYAPPPPAAPPPAETIARDQAPAPEPQAGQPRRESPAEMAERVLLEVLGGLLGGN